MFEGRPIRMITPLDMNLASLLRPLVDIGMRLAVAPHVNTLCIAHHYRLAMTLEGCDDPSRIQLADWNMNWTDPTVMRTMSGLHMHYSTKTVARELRRFQCPDLSAFFNSIPVTSYRPRNVFIRRTKHTTLFINNINGLTFSEIANKFLRYTGASDHHIPFVISDIVAQARALVNMVAKEAIVNFLHPADQLGDIVGSPADIGLWVFSAPCSEYMASRTELFFPLDVDDLPLRDQEEFETHIIWYIPDSSGDKVHYNALIQKCLEEYHDRLFKAAREADDADFEGLGNAINRVLAVRHPSFTAEIFRNSKDVRNCLRRYHHDPLSKVAVTV
jgi:hypothetical protein